MSSAKADARGGLPKRMLVVGSSEPACEGARVRCAPASGLDAGMTGGEQTTARLGAKVAPKMARWGGKKGGRVGGGLGGVGGVGVIR